MIVRLVRWVRVLLALVGLAWVVRKIASTERDIRELVHRLEGTHTVIRGVDPVSGDPYGVRLTPLSGAELRRSRELEAMAWRDAGAFATD